PKGACKLGPRMSDASPRFRQDLATSPVEADGVPCVDVSDPRTGTSFRFYDFEYQLALQLNGQPLTGVVSWASEAFGADLTPDGVTEFASRLRELGFLEGDAPTTEEMPIASPPSAEESGENPADEWMTAQSAQTAQFVPDAAMLGGDARTPMPERNPPPAQPAVPERTPLPEPVAAAPAPERHEAVPERNMGAEPTARVSLDDFDDSPPPRRSPEPATIERAVALPPEAAASAHDSRTTPAWAMALDDAPASGASAATAPGTTEVTREVKLPAVPPPTVAPPPPGVTERRQPPPPDAVVMAAFTGEAGKSEAPPRRSRAPLVIGLVLVAAAAAAGLWYWKNQHPAAAAPQAAHVHVFTPAPAAVYRWFERSGQVTAAEMLALSFASGGRLVELLPSGTEVAAGEVIGKLSGAASIETALEHHRSRVGFYKQVRDAMQAVGNTAAAHHATVMLAEKERLVAEAEAALARYTVVASEPGEIVDTLAKVGAAVAPGTPVARIKSRLLRGAFQLDPADRNAFAGLDFCRVEVIGLAPRASNDPVRRQAHPDEGHPGNGAAQPATAVDSSPLEAQVGPRFVDCEKMPARAAASSEPVQVALPGDVGLVSGQPLRLARRRFDSVFPVPAGALAGEGERRTVWVAGRDGTSEPRDVTPAELGDDALISDGLRVGDRVILDPPADLRPGSPVAIVP
ncbi:MAG TPA: hypothetical protein VHM31_22475, partial [Polyangia bacterium]|nr:hypothetical protein [Polyangia bacterium]